MTGVLGQPHIATLFWEEFYGDDSFFLLPVDTYTAEHELILNFAMY
jgi:hypothetical protein